MDKTILMLDQHKIDPSIDATDRGSYLERRAARAVLIDEVGQVALMYASKRNYHKLPGGGVDDGEDLQSALMRELLEETGCSAIIIDELGIVEEWRDADKLHQISYAYKALKVNDAAQLSLTGSEIDEGFELVWASGIEKAINLVEESIDDHDVRVSFMTKRDGAILRSALKRQ